MLKGQIVDDKFINEDSYDGLVSLIEASQGMLSLSIASCKPGEFRSSIIDRYEKELAPNIRSYRVVLNQKEPSLRGAIAQLVQDFPELKASQTSAVITAVGTEALRDFVSNTDSDDRSELSRFFGYLQWTREGLREFPYPIVLWVTPKILSRLSLEAPDFWSWRSGVFRFVSPAAEETNQQVIKTGKTLLIEPETRPSLPLEELLEQVKNLEQQAKALPALALSYNRVGQAYANRVKTRQAEDDSQESDRAIYFFQKSLELQEKLNLPRAQSDTWLQLGDFYRDLELWEQVFEPYQRSLAIAKSLADRQREAAVYLRLGNFYQQYPQNDRASNLEKAIANFEAALQVYTREAFPEQWAMTQNNLGNAYLYRIRGERAENFERAIAYYEAALEVYTRDVFDQDWAKIQICLGSAYSMRIRGNRAENFEKAIRCYEAALEVITRQVFPEYWAMIQMNLGNAYSDRIAGTRVENLERAISYHKAALEVYTRDAFPYQWAVTQMNLGITYSVRILGEKAENQETAIGYYIAALTVLNRDKFPYEWATTQMHLGIVYIFRIREERRENLEKAIDFLELALQVFTPETFPPNWANIQANLGIAYSNRIKGDRAENLEIAISYYEAALKIYTLESFPYEWAKNQNNLGNLGLAYSKLMGADKAENLEKAIGYYKNALEVFTRPAFPQECTQTLNNLGRTYHDRARYYNTNSKKKQTALEKAYIYFEQALEIAEYLRDEITSGDEAKRKLNEEWNQIYLSMVEVCLELKNYTAAIEYVERSKARNLVELLANKDIYPKVEIDQAHRQQIQQLRRDISGKQRELEILGSSREREAENRDRIKVLRSQINHLQNNLNELIAEINQIDSSFAFTQKVQPIPFSEIQSLTDEKTAIVEWYITGSQILTFIITCHHPHPIVVASERITALENWVREYWDSYQNQYNQWIKALTDRLQHLAEILHIDDLLSRIDQCFSENGAKCNRLILIPHRYLHLFPLHALPLADGKLLFERFYQGVGYAPSCQLLKQVKARKPNPSNFNRLFAIQNPTIDLVDCQIEIDTISKYFDLEHSLILKEVEATKTNIYQSMEQIRDSHCLHFACHGIFNPESPLESALLLADPEGQLEDKGGYSHFYIQEAEDRKEERGKQSFYKNKMQPDKGKFTLAEIFEKISLKQCRLVTLSACESGMTDPNSISDEYIGLPSGFLYAGSLSVVSTLWKVDQIATTLLMVKFYENLNRLPEIKTGDVAIALNQAQTWLRRLTHPQFQKFVEEAFGNSPKRDYKKLTKSLQTSLHPNRQPFPFANPYYWSAFVAIGI